MLPSLAPRKSFFSLTHRLGPFLETGASIFLQNSFWKSQTNISRPNFWTTNQKENLCLILNFKMQAKKSLGQNFLRDKGILKKIADFAQIEKEDHVVEVGPGEGTLTEFLLERAGKVVVIEKDERMVEFLKEKFEKEIKEGKLEVVEGDILELTPEKSSCSKDTHKILLNFCYSRAVALRESFSQDFSRAPAYVLVGNIPYYITGALFKKALESKNPPKSLTFVVQKEVAERVMAKDGKESILSISIKAYGEPQYGGIIKAGSFQPKPKVDSAIISVRNISKKRFQESKTNESKFFEVLKAGFAHKRKLLIRNLASMSRLNLDILKPKEIFEKCGIPEKARAENLKVEDWVCLTKELTK
jgi:16S rRNA (adenine1518-N6/adenine1519-N6)-dimethyltransferase